MSVHQSTSRRVSLDTGLDYHVLEWGANDASLDHTVVLVHGFLDLSWGWHGTVNAGLAGHYHIIAPDMRGHGDSDRVGAGGYYHFMDYLADVHSLLDQVGRARVSLVGHSMGGSICSYYAGAYPDRVHRLALLEGTGPPERDQTAPQRIQTWLLSWKHARNKTPRAYPSVAAAADRLRALDDRLDEDQALFLADKGTTAAPDGSRAFKHDPLHLTMGPYPFRVANAMELWRNISCPVLLVEGSESTFRHTDEERTRRHNAFRNHTEATLDGAAHMMQRHQPAALANLLGDFLES